MPLLATFTIACLSTLPQEGTAAAASAKQQQPLLTPAEQKSLHDKLAEMIAALAEYDEASDNKRDKAAKAYERAKKSFHQEWDGKVEKKGDLMASFVDLQAIFDNCFLYPRESSSSIRKVNAKDGISAYSYSIPKAYRPDVPCRTILLLPGRDERGWVDGREYFGQTWDKTPAVGDTIFHVPAVAAEVDLDPIPDYSREGADRNEGQRIGELWLSYGELQRSYNVDRSRLYLDAGKDACGFALRAANHFPDRFAGLVLRHPVAVDAIRLGSLTGVPVLLLRSAATADACNNLEKRLNALSPGQCTVLDAKGAYPFAESTPEIEAWMKGVQREVNRGKVVLEPNDDRFKKGFWVAIGNMDTIHTAPSDKKPRVEVVADRATNRVTVKAVGVESLELLLNDALLDLGKEFTVVVNDKAFTEKRDRSFGRMLDFVMQRFDPGFLFPVTVRVSVPREEQKSGEDGEGGNK